MTVAGRSAASARIRSVRAIASASVALPFRWLKLSVAASVTFTRSSEVARNRSKPRSLRTRPESSVPSCGPSAATTSSAPAICGTASSRTKLTASTRGTRAAASRPTSSARTAGASVSRLVLEPVARADVADQRHYPDAVTRSGLILDDHALLRVLLVHVVVLAPVAARELVDVLRGAVLGQLRRGR